MQRHRDNEQVIVGYLLGSLPDAEMERLEHRYLEDEVLFEELQEIEDELIDNYVTGALSAEQRAQFEQYFLRSPQRREKLEFARAMTEHAVSWNNQRQADNSLSSIQRDDVGVGEKDETEGKVLPFKRWSGPVPAWRQWAAVAAAILIAVAGGSLWFRNRELRRELIAADVDAARSRTEANAQSARTKETSEQLSAEKARAGALEEHARQVEETLAQLQAARKAAVSVFIGLEYLVRNTRGGELKVKTMVIPTSAELLRLNVEFERSKSEKFRATLKREETTVWTSGVLGGRRKGDEQAVSLNIPTAPLSPGQYDLTIRDAGQGEAVAHYVLRVVRH